MYISSFCNWSEIVLNIAFDRESAYGDREVSITKLARQNFFPSAHQQKKRCTEMTAGRYYYSTIQWYNQYITLHHTASGENNVNLFLSSESSNFRPVTTSHMQVTSILENISSIFILKRWKWSWFVSITLCPGFVLTSPCPVNLPEWIMFPCILSKIYHKQNLYGFPHIRIKITYR